jgi:cytochrome c553
MMAVARQMSDADIAALAERFGTADPARDRPLQDGSNAAVLALRGDAARDVPACLSCHHTGDPDIHPAIIGQDEDYLRRQLSLFVPAEPGAAPIRQDPGAQIMAEAARELTEEDITAIAAWLAGQGG